VLGANASKLPAGGGEPGRAWLDQKCKPLPALPDFKDPKAVEKYLAEQGMTEQVLKEEAARMSKLQGRRVTREDVIRKMIEVEVAMAGLADATTLKDCKVLGGAHDGRIAILEVKVTMAGEPVRTDVTLVKDGGAWTVKKEGTWRSVK
jgi:hypothetical protein